MSSIVNSKIVLKLNAVWQPIDELNVKEALIAMNSGDEFTGIAAVAMNIIRPQIGENDYDFSPENADFHPVSWEEWIKLPIRPFDDVIHTPRMQIRVPTVIIAPNFSKIIKKIPKPTNRGVLERDNYTCQYTGVKLTKATATIDHRVPKALGGQNTWENMVACHKDVNFKKGCKTNKEAGLTLLRTPKAPSPVIIKKAIKEARNRDWDLFLYHK